MMTTSMPLFKNKQYLRFFASFTIGNIGDWFDFFALQIIFAHNFHASAWVIALMSVIYMAPFALFGGVGGMLADKYNKKWVMVITDVLSGVFTVALVYTHIMLLAMLLVFIRSTTAGLNAPAQNASVKFLVPEDQLLKASSYSNIVFQLCKIIGPMLGAIVVAQYSAYMCLQINAVSFFVSALVLLSVNSSALAAVKSVISDAKEQSAGFVAQMKEVVRFILHHDTLGVILPVSLIVFMFIMMAELQMVVLLRAILPMMPEILGVVLGFSAAGAALSGVYCARKKELEGYSGYLVVSFVLMALGYALFSVFQSQWLLWLLYLASVISGVGFGLLITLYSYVLKKESPEEAVGKISGVLGSIQGLMLLLGAAFGGAITSFFGPRVDFMVTALACAVAGIYVITRCVRQDKIP